MLRGTSTSELGSISYPHVELSCVHSQSLSPPFFVRPLPAIQCSPATSRRSREFRPRCNFQDGRIGPYLF